MDSKIAAFERSWASKAAYLSRVSNADVLAKARHTSESQMLRKRRLQLFGKIMRSEPGHPLRQACFIGETLRPVTERYIRRRGRPNVEWTTVVLKDVCRFFGSAHRGAELAKNKHQWNILLSSKLKF